MSQPDKQIVNALDIIAAVTTDHKLPYKHMREFLMSSVEDRRNWEMPEFEADDLVRLAADALEMLGYIAKQAKAQGKKSGSPIGDRARERWYQAADQLTAMITLGTMVRQTIKQAILDDIDAEFRAKI